MTSSLKSVCVYCGSSDRVTDPFKEAAQEMGILLAQAGIRLVYGGGQLGLMGIIANSALKAGGLVTGFTTRHLDSYEIGHRGITELFVEEDMHTRKLSMFEASDAFIVLPGGYGTLDELFETLTWKQIGLHSKPLVIVNIEGYWDGLKMMLENIVKNQFAYPDALDLVEFSPSPSEALQFLSKRFV